MPPSPIASISISLKIALESSAISRALRVISPLLPCPKILLEILLPPAKDNDSALRLILPPSPTASISISLRIALESSVISRALRLISPLLPRSRVVVVIELPLLKFNNSASRLILPPSPRSKDLLNSPDALLIFKDFVLITIFPPCPEPTTSVVTNEPLSNRKFSAVMKIPLPSESPPTSAKIILSSAMVIFLPCRRISPPPAPLVSKEAPFSSDISANVS